MRDPATTVDQQAHLAGVAYQIKHAGGSSLVVTTADETRRPVAIITDADISQAVADGRSLEDTRVSQLQLPPPITMPRDGTVVDAVRVMLDHRIHHLPVVDGDRLVGLVEMADLCRAMVDLPSGQFAG
jgi:signal-transduction protein with cAMP-binding, CBS, and nucleotidyltransferase domain